MIHIHIVFFPFSSVDSAPSVSGQTQPVSAQRKPSTRTGVTMKNDLSCLVFPSLFFKKLSVCWLNEQEVFKMYWCS